MVFDNLFEYFGGGSMSADNTFCYSERYRFPDISESYDYTLIYCREGNYVRSQLLSLISGKWYLLE